MDASYKVWADVPKNRLYLILKGFMPDEMVKAAADLTIEEAKKLQPGFQVINDISELKPASQAGADEIKRAQAFLGSRGVKRVIRIVKPDNVTAKLQFARSSKDFYKADTAASIEDAESILDHTA
jgi:hypothetical protein